MKLMHIALVVIAGTIGVSVAMSREPAGGTPPAAVEAEKQGNVQAEPGNLRRVLELFRSDLNATKIFTLNQVMKLSEGEAEKFWPIYQKYEAELAKLDDRRIELIRTFVTLSEEGKLNDQNSGPLAESWLQVVQGRLDLWKKYNREIGAALSPIRAAQFLQVEHQISLLVDINIASEMPMVGQPK